ncbi:hypothetical protein EfmJHP9_18620 [Enterococcus faecium]|nr:hypothetical protein EfmJHP9_18620 [Enterococcus faecium]
MSRQTANNTLNLVKFLIAYSLSLNKIVSVVNKLDKELDELDTLSENPEKKHNLRIQ